MQTHRTKSTFHLVLRGGLLLAAGLMLAPVQAGTTYPDAIRRFERGDHANAVAVLTQYAERNDARAQLFIGSQMLMGKDVPLNRPQGLAWVQIAAAKPWGSFGGAAAESAKEALLR